MLPHVKNRSNLPVSLILEFCRLRTVCVRYLDTPYDGWRCLLFYIICRIALYYVLPKWLARETRLNNSSCWAETLGSLAVAGCMLPGSAMKMTPLKRTGWLGMRGGLHSLLTTHSSVYYVCMSVCIDASYGDGRITERPRSCSITSLLPAIFDAAHPPCIYLRNPDGRLAGTENAWCRVSWYKPTATSPKEVKLLARDKGPAQTQLTPFRHWIPGFWFLRCLVPFVPRRMTAPADQPKYILRPVWQCLYR